MKAWLWLVISALSANRALAEEFACTASGQRYDYIVGGAVSRTAEGKYRVNLVDIWVKNKGDNASFFMDRVMPKGPGLYGAPNSTAALTVAINPDTFDIAVWHEDAGHAAGARRYPCTQVPL